MDFPDSIYDILVSSVQHKSEKSVLHDVSTVLSSGPPELSGDFMLLVMGDRSERLRCMEAATRCATRRGVDSRGRQTLVG